MLKLLWYSKSKITKVKNGKNVPHLEITEVVLVHCKFIINDHQHNSRVLFIYTIVANKSFGQLLDISPKKIIFFKTFNSVFSYIEVWFTDQNSIPLEREHHFSY